MNTAVLQQLIAEGRIADPDSPRGRLLAVAARLFREKGYSRTTVRDLAGEVGILSGSIFHHFANKDDILYEVMRDVVVYITASLEQAVAAAETAVDRVRALIRTELDFIQQDTGDAMAVLVFEWRALSPERQREILDIRARYENLWLEVLRDAEREGLIAIEADVLRQFMHGALSWTTYWYQKQGKLSLEELVERALTLAIKTQSDQT